MKIGKLNCNIISAGNWKGDGGATMGVLPKALWQKFMTVDAKNRVLLSLNLLLIETKDKKILIDTGIGNKITDKIKKIYEPTPFRLIEQLYKMNLKPADIDYVILTHLHFDHAGGVVSRVGEDLQLTFPNAVHLIQEKEWETAKQPDELNRASYNFKADLSLLEQYGKIKLVDGDFEVASGISLELVGGHSEGMQVVRLESEGDLAYYAGDIIPLDSQRHLAVNSAYEICRKDSFRAKKKILSELKEKKGILFYAHDAEKQWIRIN